MVTASAPIAHEQFHALDFSGQTWWARMLCVQAGGTCTGLLIQDHLAPVTGSCAGIYDHEKELVMGLLTSDTAQELGEQITRATDTNRPYFNLNLATRKTLRLFKEGKFDEVLRSTCEERGKAFLSAGTDDELYAELIKPRLEAKGYEKEIRGNHLVWSRRIE